MGLMAKLLTLFARQKQPLFSEAEAIVDQLIAEHADIFDQAWMPNIVE